MAPIKNVLIQNINLTSANIKSLGCLGTFGARGGGNPRGGRGRAIRGGQGRGGRGGRGGGEADDSPVIIKKKKRVSKLTTVEELKHASTFMKWPGLPGLNAQIDSQISKTELKVAALKAIKKEVEERITLENGEEVGANDEDLEYMAVDEVPTQT